MREVRDAIRRLKATPGVTTCAIICLSVGVWMTCIVSAIGGGYFRPRLDLPAPERLVQIDEFGLFATQQNIYRATFERSTSAAVFDSLAKKKVFAAIGFYQKTSVWVAGEKRNRSATMLSSGMMDVLGMHLRLGRRFMPADDSIATAIISHDLWRSMFGSDPNVIGRRVQFRYPRAWVQVVGVAEEGFGFPRNTGRVDLYLSAGISATQSRSISSRTGLVSSGDISRTALARLRDGQSLGDARDVVSEIALRTVASDREVMVKALRAEYQRRRPPTLVMGPVDVRVSRYYNEPTRGDANFVILVLGCGLAVALIASSNVVNLLLIRGASRRQEIAVRMALGASRFQVVNGLVIEAGIIAAFGTMIGFAVAYWQWQHLDPTIDNRYWFGQIEWSNFPVALGAGLALTLIVGVWPGLRATAMNIEQVLRDTRRAGMNASPLDSVLGRLVAASTAGTVMLMVCAILLAVSADQWVFDSGYRARKGLSSILTFDASHPREQRAALARQVLTRVRGTNDIGYAAFGGLPMGADQKELFGSPDGGPGRRLTATQVYDVSDGWLEAMGIRMSSGRRFTPAEARDSTNHVIISRSMASTLFGGQVAVDRTFRYWDSDSVMVEALVVGVAETQPGAKYQLYRPFGQLAPAQASLVIGANSSGAIASPSTVNKALREIPGVLSSDVEALDAQPTNLPKIFRYLLIAFVMFAVVGVVLGAIGMYGIIAYSVVRRTHEIGVRIALGADRTRVIWMILEQGLKITLIGAAFGLILSYWSTRLLGSMVQDVKMNYPLTMAGVVLLVSAVAVIACLIPGYRAGRLNPVDALRAD